MKLNPLYLYKFFAVMMMVSVMFVAIAPRAMAATRVGIALPGFDKFVKSVTTGEAGVVRGVYVANVLAIPVRQQPANDPSYVATTAGIATQFQMAADHGVTGLLAHNYAAGKQFFSLAVGQEVRVVFGDSQVKRYIVSAIYQYQALEPNNPRGDLVDLSTGLRVSAVDVFSTVYTGGDHVTFQTCIKKDKNASWGRLFVVATPVQ